VLSYVGIGARSYFSCGGQPPRVEGAEEYLATANLYIDTVARGASQLLPSSFLAPGSWSSPNTEAHIREVASAMTNEPVAETAAVAAIYNIDIQ
jgi:hypothetical protein